MWKKGALRRAGGGGRCFDFLSAASRRSERFWHSFNGVLALSDVHDGHTRNLADAAPQIFIARGDDEATVLSYHLHNIIIGVVPFFEVALHSHEPRVLGHTKCDSVLRTQFLELSHDRVENHWNALGVEAIHHGTDNIELVFYRKVDEIRIHNHMVRRSQLRVVLEKKSRGRNVHLLRRRCEPIIVLLLAFTFSAALILVKTIARGLDHALYMSKLASLFRFAHLDKKKQRGTKKETRKKEMKMSAKRKSFFRCVQ